MHMNWYDLKVKTLKIQRRIFADKEKELSKAEYERLLTAAKNKKNDYDEIGSLKEFTTSSFPNGYIQSGSYIKFSEYPLIYKKIGAKHENDLFEAGPILSNKKIAIYIGRY